MTDQYTLLKCRWLAFEENNKNLKSLFEQGEKMFKNSIASVARQIFPAATDEAIECVMSHEDPDECGFYDSDELESIYDNTHAAVDAARCQILSSVGGDLNKATYDERYGLDVFSPLFLKARYDMIDYLEHSIRYDLDGGVCFANGEKMHGEPWEKRMAEFADVRCELHAHEKESD